MSHCPYYNQGLFIGTTPDEQVKIGMCCWQTKQNVNQVSFDHPYLVALREEGKTRVPEACAESCSMPGHIDNERERSLIEWPLLISENTKSKGIRVLHLEQSLLCNLKCISCSSLSSSSWNGEYQQFDPTAPTVTLAKQPEEQWRNLDLSELRRIHFTGGEPLLNRDNKKILAHLDQLGLLSKIVLTYNTNGTVIPDQETLTYWRRARLVRLYFSLDGVESTFEYTRFPAQWNEVENNIKYFRSLKDICIMIEVDAIVGVHNIFNLPDFFTWWEEHCQTGSQGDPSRVFVRYILPSTYGGRVLDLAHLSKKHAEQACDMLKLLVKYPGVQDLINYIQQNRKPSTKWVEYLDQLDRNRGISWRQALPKQIQEEIFC